MGPILKPSASSASSSTSARLTDSTSTPCCSEWNLRSAQRAISRLIFSATARARSSGLAFIVSSCVNVIVAITPSEVAEQSAERNPPLNKAISPTSCPGYLRSLVSPTSIARVPCKTTPKKVAASPFFITSSPRSKRCNERPRASSSCSSSLLLKPLHWLHAPWAFSSSCRRGTPPTWSPAPSVRFSLISTLIEDASSVDWSRCASSWATCFLLGPEGWGGVGGLDVAADRAVSHSLRLEADAAASITDRPLVSCTTMPKTSSPSTCSSTRAPRNSITPLIVGASGCM